MHSILNFGRRKYSLRNILLCKLCNLFIDYQPLRTIFSNYVQERPFFIIISPAYLLYDNIRYKYLIFILFNFVKKSQGYFSLFRSIIGKMKIPNRCFQIKLRFFHMVILYPFSFLLPTIYANVLGANEAGRFERENL